MATFRETASRFLAGAFLPQLPPAKVSNKQVAFPGFKKTVAVLTGLMPQAERALAQSDILTYRQGASTKQVVRDLAASSPDLAATVSAYIRVGIPNDYTVIARTMDGLIDTQSTQLAQEILRRLTFVSDPSLGYNSFGSLEELSSSMAKQMLFTGSMALELVLDKTRMPTQLSPIETSSIYYYEDKQLGMVRPVQRIGGIEIDLGIPSIFIYNLDQQLISPYSESPLEAAIQPILADADFLNSLRRVMRRAIHPRLVGTIDEAKVLASMPPEISNSVDKQQAYMNNLISQVQTDLGGLNPEDALVSFDSIKYSFMVSEGPGGKVGDTLKTVQDMLNNKISAGAKSLPAILGRTNSNGTSASVETMLFLKNANAVRVALNTIYSRALTVAIRLFGQDSYVDFEYAELDMRPSAEMEAYKAMAQSRIFNLLSLGFITDAEACVELTGNLPPAGYVNKAGTMFMKGVNMDPIAAPNSQTGTMNVGTPAAPMSPSSPNPKGPKLPAQSAPDKVKPVTMPTK